MNQRHPDSESHSSHTAVAVEKWQQQDASLEFDQVAEELPVALVYNGISYAVMMATPDNLDDFAMGFSLTEGLISHPNEIYDIELEQTPTGCLVQINLAAQRMLELKARRRNLAGRTGCGLCGTESIEQAIRQTAVVPAAELPKPEAIETALAELNQKQPLQAITGASHAAAWCNSEGDILHIREDIGRHNALDKLIGFLARSQENTETGFILISSRASYEMVQKTSQAGISSLVAVSAATSLAARLANESNMNLIGFARPGRFVVYSRSSRSEAENNDA